MSTFPYRTISEFFEDQGDFPENLEPDPTIAEHAFIPGDGEMTRSDICQYTGCGFPLSEHEEGEPCCFPFYSTRGQQHAFNCEED